MSYPGSRVCRFFGFGTPHRCRFRKWVETTRGDRRAFAVPLNSIVFSNAEYPAAVRTLAGPPCPDNVDYSKVFLLLLFRIEHGGVSKGLALRLIQTDRVQSD